METQLWCYFYYYVGSIPHSVFPSLVHLFLWVNVVLWTVKYPEQIQFHIHHVNLPVSLIKSAIDLDPCQLILEHFSLLYYPPSQSNLLEALVQCCSQSNLNWILVHQSLSIPHYILSAISMHQELPFF